MTSPLDDQARIPQQTGPAPAEPPTPPATRPSRRWWWIAAAAVALIGVGAGVFFALRPSDSDEAADRCRSEITSKLKSPSTAKYGDETVTTSSGDFGTYFEVSGVVDAQNGFGATVRLDYRCKVTLENDGDWLVTESTATQR